MARFEVRCHEWGDDSDYHWEYCDTREEADKLVEEHSNMYEHLYVIEIKDDNK